ncbi:GAF and ANTAR domain-containing protein [Ilumatobacter sp.]|uniref:GAF and ANTAR domain-containing protein n=1 Tax=Ilumatobacter sp. TaxID=1967498 RepID=UPI003B52422A
MAGPSQLVGVLERFATTMAGTYEVDDVLYELGDRTVEILDARGAGVSVANEQGQLLFVTATSETVIAVERTQEQNQAGPCVEAFATGEVVAVRNIADLDSEDYRRAARESGFESVVGVPLWTGATRIGSLNVYDDQVRDWNVEELRVARVLADIAATYIVRAGELEQQRRLSGQLQHALDSRVVIEQAKGIIAHSHGVPVGQAFDLLRTHSRRTNTPLRQLADAVVTLGLELPPSSP